jgi:hypothetical protein
MSWAPSRGLALWLRGLRGGCSVRTTFPTTKGVWGLFLDFFAAGAGRVGHFGGQCGECAAAGPDWSGEFAGGLGPANGNRSYRLAANMFWWLRVAALYCSSLSLPSCPMAGAEEPLRGSNRSLRARRTHGQVDEPCRTPS